MKLRFKATKSHRNHYDNWNSLKDGGVGEYPDDVGKEKLRDFPDNFEVVKPGKVKPDESAAEKAPDKSMKSKRTKIK